MNVPQTKEKSPLGYSESSRFENCSFGYRKSVKPGSVRILGTPNPDFSRIVFAWSQHRDRSDLRSARTRKYAPIGNRGLSSSARQSQGRRGNPPPFHAIASRRHRNPPMRPHFGGRLGIRTAATGTRI